MGFLIIIGIIRGKINEWLCFSSYQPSAHDQISPLSVYQLNNHMSKNNKLYKGQNHTIIPIDAEKSVYKIQHTFKVKTLNKLEIGGNFLNLIKDIYKTQSYQLLYLMEKDWKFSPKIKNKRRMSVSYNMVLEVWAKATSQEK